MTRASPLAKIVRPALAGSFPRKTLFRRLDDARKRPVVWVSGPPGSGKTTLVSSYVAARKLSCLWYRVDEGDADIATFFYYLGLAARRASPGGRKPLPLLTPEFLPGIAVFTQRFFEELFSRLPRGSVVVFDDFQNAPDGAPFHEVVRDGLSRLPAGINAVVIGRSEPPPAFARLRAGSGMAFIGWKDLRLSAAEAEGIARLRGGRAPRGRAVRELQRMVDGWAAGLVLLLEKAGAGGLEPWELRGQAPDEIFDYFAGEVLAKADEGVRPFLLESAVFPRMTPAMAEKLTGQARAGQILAALNRQNYFTGMHPGTDPVYEYHSLFRMFLLAQAQAAMATADIARVRRRAAAILEESGMTEDAVALFREAGDREGLVRVVRKEADTLIRQGRSQTLEEWMRVLPREPGEADPWILYWRGICRLPFDPGESRLHFEDAFRLFRERRDAQGVFLAWAGAVDAIVYGSDGLKPLDPWFPLLDDLLGEFRGFPSPEIGGRVTCRMIKALSLRRPPSYLADEWADRALASARGATAADPSLAIDALANLACYRYHGGDFRKTGLLLDSLRELARRPGVSPLSRLVVGWVEAAHANVSGARDDCLKVSAAALALADATGVHLMDYMLLGHGALAFLHKGDAAAAQRFLRRMASALSAAAPWQAAFYHFVAGWEALHRGDRAHAALHADQCLKLSDDVGNPWTAALAHLQEAFVRVESGDPGRGAEHLERSRRIGEGSRMTYVAFLGFLAEAYFAIRRGDGTAAHGPLREGLRIGREMGYAGTLLFRPGFLETVAAFALDEGIESEYARDLIRRNGIVPDEASLDVERWPWPVKVFTLGGFRIERDGKPVPSSRKARNKQLMMLKALIALGGRDVTEAQLTDILWPDTDGDLGHQSFATTLRRLRGLLGNEKAVPLREGRLSLHAPHLWVDAFAFERIVGKIDRGREGGPPGDPAPIDRLAEKAFALYRGPFLPGEAFCPCIVSVRERLRSKFLRCVGLAGRHWESAGEWETAVTWYRKGLEVDDLAEETYRRLIACLKRLGRDAEALAAYRQCRKTLAAILGVSPSPETDALVKISSPA